MINVPLWYVPPQGTLKAPLSLRQEERETRERATVSERGRQGLGYMGNVGPGRAFGSDYQCDGSLESLKQRREVT